MKERRKNLLYMLGLLLMMAVIWTSGIFIGRMTTPEKTTTENYSLNLDLPGRSLTGIQTAKNWRS